MTQVPPQTQQVTRENALAELGTLFATLGLPQTLVPWAWDRIVLGKTQTEIMLEIEQTAEFKARFPGIEAARNKGITPLSPAEYVAYETAAMETARRYGLPETFYQRGNPAFDQRLSDAMANGVSARQYQERLNDGFARVAEAPAEVRDGFDRLFGVRGDAALATVYLDPANAQAELDRMTRAAEAGGTGDVFGIHMNRDRAMEVADYRLSLEELRKGYGELSDQKGIFDERTNETRDLTAEQEGVGAVFNLNEDARQALRRRQAEREALTGGAGAATTSQRGVGGLGTAR